MVKRYLCKVWALVLVCFCGSAQAQIWVDSLPELPSIPGVTLYVDSSIIEEHPAILNVEYDGVEGIDISHYQGKINWNRLVRSGEVSFLYIKATEGDNYPDDCYRANLDSARAHNIPVGSYHLYSPKRSVVAQFDAFKRRVHKHEQTLIPMLDIEARYARRLNMASVDKLLSLMERHYGRKPLIYTSSSVYFSHFANRPRYAGYHFYLADYRYEPRAVYTLWQYTSHGSVDGIKGNVDRCRFGEGFSLSDLRLFN